MLFIKTHTSSFFSNLGHALLIFKLLTIDEFLVLTSLQVTILQTMPPTNDNMPGKAQISQHLPECE